MVEYGLAVALVALIAMVGLMALGSGVNSAFCKIEQGFSRVSCPYSALSGPVSSASYTSVASGVSSFTAQAVTQFPTNTIVGASTFIMSDGVGYKVGYQSTSAGCCQTLVQKTTNNGATWTTMTSPNAEGWDTLEAVFCVNDTSCVAVGYGYSGTTTWTQVPVAMRLNGSSWSLLTLPSPNPYQAGLDAVACSTTTCVAAGSDNSTTTGTTYVVTGSNLETIASSTNIGNVTTVGFNPGDNLFWLGA